MTYLTVGALKRILEKYDDDTKIAIKSKHYNGNVLYYDLKCNNTNSFPSEKMDTFYLHSDRLDLTIESETRMLKEE